VVKASHQFPGGKGDPRDEMVQIIAREVEKANVGLKIQVFTGSSLFKLKEKWNVMARGVLDMSAFPLDCAAGQEPAFSATLMPGLVGNYERAKRLNTSPFMQDIKKHINDAGIVVIADAWLSGAFASKKNSIKGPESIKGKGGARGGTSLRADARRGGRLDLVHAVQRNLYRLADRRARRDQHVLGQLRLLPPL
jgi:TRAP-type C4-dicarboxylate transport system substrate-binding protein